jgi:hypothetical protein
MKIIIAFILFCSSLQVSTQSEQKDSIIARTESPALFEKDGAGLAFAMTEEEYKKVEEILDN